jgi:hypothetical protein
MKSPHLLRAATNVQKLKENLVNVVDAAAIGAIQVEINANVVQLYTLGRNHYLFAVRQNNRSWRQKISRLYYAAYNVSRAVRLSKHGEFSTDSSDHKKIESLPDDFPNANTYTNRLGVLRDDRNLCDYDHTGRRTDLVIGVIDAADLVTEFLKDARAYLIRRGVAL